MNSFKLIVLILLIIGNKLSNSTESSGEYLQKVMIELQELNVPTSSALHDRLSMNLDYQQANYQNHEQDNTYRKLNTKNTQQEPQQNKHKNIPKPTANLPVGQMDLTHSASQNTAQYYTIRDSTATNYPKVKQTEPLAFTRAELASLYKKALEKGSAVSVSSLTQALNAAGNTPQVAATGHLHLPVKYPMYNYYFFPLKSFASELQRDHGHQAMITPMFEATETVQNTQKQLMNPLFMAIGTFISMALLFMMGVLFLPKLPHLQLFNARTVDDDFQRLTTFVMNAIDGYDISEKFYHS